MLSFHLVSKADWFGNYWWKAHYMGSLKSLKSLRKLDTKSKKNKEESKKKKSVKVWRPNLKTWKLLAKNFHTCIKCLWTKSFSKWEEYDEVSYLKVEGI